MTHGELLTSSELASSYGLLRDTMEALLVEIGAKVHCVGGETRYDPEQVAELLAAKDHAAQQEIVAFLGPVENDELAATVLGEVMRDLLDEWLRTTDEAIGKEIDAARRAIRGRLRSFALERTWTKKQNAGTREGVVAAAWEELALLQQLRDDLLASLAEHRAQRSSPANPDSLPSEPVPEAPARKEERNRRVKAPK